MTTGISSELKNKKGKYCHVPHTVPSRVSCAPITFAKKKLGGVVWEGNMRPMMKRHVSTFKRLIYLEYLRYPSYPKHSRGTSGTP